MKIALLNTSICTDAGVYSLKDITLEKAKEVIGYYNGNIDSAVGHQSTAEIMTTLLGVDVPVNRRLHKQKEGELALVFKLNGRPREGKILTVEEIEEIGYKFQLLEKYSRPKNKEVNDFISHLFC